MFMEEYSIVTSPPQVHMWIVCGFAISQRWIYNLYMLTQGVNYADYNTLSRLDQYRLKRAIEEHEALIINREYRETIIPENELLEIFPEAKKIIPEKLEEYEKRIENLNKLYQKLLVAVVSVKDWSQQAGYLGDMIKRLELKTNKEIQAFMADAIWIIYFEPTIEELNARMKTLDRLERLSSNKDNPNTITDSDIQLAKTIPIETYLDGKFRAMGGRLMLRCPFHNERTPSFVVYLNTNTYSCFGGCSEKGGDVIKFVMKKYELDFIKAVKFILKK